MWPVATSTNYRVYRSDMDDVRLHKYYRSSGINSLIYRFLVADRELRSFFKLNPYCGVITVLTCLLGVIVIICSAMALSTMTSDERVFQELQNDAKKKIPRKQSVLCIRPAYNCVHKHLRQTNVFQEKTKKMLRKEHLETEIMNSRVSCIKKLLNPEAQSEWRRSRSPKIYYRPICSVTPK